MLREAERERRSAPITGGHRGLVCAACGHLITDNADRIAMAGAHEHTFVNPAGHDFRIGCFAAAPGCTDVGAEDPTFSWFPGWTWQIALCGRCHAHLGWTYRNADQQFWGLILAALRPADR